MLRAGVACNSLLSLRSLSFRARGWRLEADIHVSFYCAVKTTSKHLSIRTCHGERFYIKHGGAEGLHHER